MAIRTAGCAVGCAVIAVALALPGAAAAAYPGANGMVAFTSTADGPRHIFVEAAGTIADLTGASSPAAETQPKFSPDGTEILFTGVVAGQPQLFAMGAAGKDRVQLTSTPTGNSDGTWSPDGSQIAFVSPRNGGIPQIFVMRTDGTDVRQITHDAAGKAELAWSPRGHEIAFVRTENGDRKIDSIGLDGSGLEDLTNDPSSFDLEPAFSPDGSKIVYSGPLQPGRVSVGGDLWIMPAAGGAPQPLAHESNGYSDGAYPAWSPDGTTIAFIANDGSGYNHVWSVGVGGGENTPLVANAIMGGNPVDQEVDWQPLPAHPALPNTVLRSSRVARRRATFSFQSTGATTSYLCSLRHGRTRARFAPCAPSQAYGRLRPGRYTFEVRAVGPGESDPSPAVHTFTIKK